MTQVYSADCLHEFAALPDLRPHFIGTVASEPAGNSLLSKWCDEAPRRRDTPRKGGKESYGGLTSKIPSINPAKVDVFGIGIPTGKVGYDTVATSFGSVKVPKEVDTMQYTPTGDTLHFLTHSQGSRLLPHPPRYFP